MQSSAAASKSACSAADAAAPGVPGLTAQAAAVLQCCRAADQTSGPGSQSELSGSTCLMEPAILSGSDHYPAL